MGESTCLMQPFSYASGLPKEGNEGNPIHALGQSVSFGNPIHALGQSVSFGRFMSEPLSWEKWSAFSSNRYVEEAERYSRPGSVAQKKAFFEAHYRSLAARKAAALLEQANAASRDDANSQVQAEADAENSSPPASVNVQEVKAPATQTKLPQDAHMVEPTEVGGTDGFKDESSGRIKDVDHEAETVHPGLDEANKPGNSEKKIESSTGLSEAADTRKVLEELELSETSQMEKPLLKNLISNESGFEATSQRRQIASSLRPPGYTKVSKLLPSPSPAKLLPSARSKKENHSTPNIKKPATDAADRKRSTPKASHRSISFTPAKEFNKLTATIMRKMDGSRRTSNFKPASDCSTPLRTPTMGQASSSGRPKHPSETPGSETKSARKPFDSSASVRKSVRARWSFLNTDSKFFSASRNESKSPGIFASFTLRTEERAARRKQKLEEKFNTSQTKNAQHQATLKAKAGTELKKLNPSFCFKARPLPDFYKRSAKKQQEEASLKHQETATAGAINPTPSRPSTLQNANSIPRQRSLKKNLDSKQLPEKRNHNLAHYLDAQGKMTPHENTYPNVLPVKTHSWKMKENFICRS